MKILFLTHNSEYSYGARCFWGLEQAVKKYTECISAGPGYPDHKESELIQQTVERLMPDADWVFDNREGSFIIPKKRDYKVCTQISDMQGKWSHKILGPLNWANFLKKTNYDLIFGTYSEIHGTGEVPDLFNRILGERYVWLPVSVDPDELKPLPDKIYDITYLGSLGLPTYPMRTDMYQKIERIAQRNRFRLLRKTGTSKIASQPASQPYSIDIRTLRGMGYYGEDYYRVLGQSRVFITDVSKYRYPVEKQFDARSCGCCVLSDEPAGAEDLGFKNGADYIKTNIKDWEKDLLWVLGDSDLVKKIGENARKLILGKHTHDIRAKQLIGTLEKNL